MSGAKITFGACTLGSDGDDHIKFEASDCYYPGPKPYDYDLWWRALLGDDFFAFELGAMLAWMIRDRRRPIFIVGDEWPRRVTKGS